MSETIDALLYDMLAWLARGDQPYADVMNAWRTSCPRLTVWEDAVDSGYVVRRRAEAAGVLVEVTPLGLGLLQAARRA